jgi:NitT/TauT family transport system substrate-binding protein
MKYLVMLMTVTMLYLPGCTPQPPAPLAVGTCIRIGCEPLYLARELGYFGSAPVRIVEYDSATEVLRAFRNGAINAAALSLDEVLQLSQHVPGVHLVLVLNYSNGADVVLGQQDVHSLADLRGKRVGVENTALGAYVLARALAAGGLDRKDIQLIPLPVDQHERAFLDHRVDAVVTFEPIHSRLEAEGAHHLFDSREMPKEMINVLAVRAAYLEKHPDIVQALLHGWFRALDRMNSQPADSLRRMAQSRQMWLPDYVDSLKGYHFLSIEENRRLFVGSPSPLEMRMQSLSSFMLAHGLLKMPAKPQEIQDGGPIEALRSHTTVAMVVSHAF